MIIQFKVQNEKKTLNIFYYAFFHPFITQPVYNEKSIENKKHTRQKIIFEKIIKSYLTLVTLRNNFLQQIKEEKKNKKKINK